MVYFTADPKEVREEGGSLVLSASGLAFAKLKHHASLHQHTHFTLKLKLEFIT